MVVSSGSELATPNVKDASGWCREADGWPQSRSDREPQRSTQLRLVPSS